MIDVAPFAGCGSTALAAELTPDVDEVDHRSARPQVHYAQIVAALDQFGAENLAVKSDASFEILDAQDNVIDLFNCERLHWSVP
ncbi:hypothetical protein D3C81_2166550 [compost metagenome]